ncbi:hypothetical protein [Streptomyces sp. MJM1172]|uniref:hypothetical protein n=1 Tax=Streptomyces sp. MJM1172 TaxID=1703926 RepID=UPI0011614415|nr:hypothetical protein [Streptomyces sp. MJM1172]
MSTRPVGRAVGDPTRGALTDPAVFEAAARRFPATAAWLGLDPEPRPEFAPRHDGPAREQWDALVPA